MMNTEIVVGDTKASLNDTVDVNVVTALVFGALTF